MPRRNSSRFAYRNVRALIAFGAPRWFTAASGPPRKYISVYRSAWVGPGGALRRSSAYHAAPAWIAWGGVFPSGCCSHNWVGRPGLRLLCNLLRPAHTLRLLYAYHRESNSERVISSPNYAALANIIASNLQHEFIWNSISSHTSDLCAAIRKATQDARAGQVAFRVVDCCRRIPLDPKILAPLAWHSRVPIAPFQPIT
jgi:hypothetical protein